MYSKLKFVVFLLFILNLARLSHSATISELIEGGGDVIIVPAGLKTHGEFCNATAHCDSAGLLVCSENPSEMNSTTSSCQCVLPEAMLFSERFQRCISLLDEPCGHLFVDDGAEVFLQCGENAICIDSICQCSPGHYSVGDTREICTLQKGFGEECSESKECSGKLGLSCVNETCGCDKTASVDSSRFYDHEDGESERRCLGRPDHPCISEQCVPNAKCIETPEIGSKICSCESGYMKSKSGKLCVGTYNKSCDTQSNLLCHKEFSCIKGLCSCKYPLHQLYSKESQHCQSLVGGPCDISMQNCVPNAICKRLELEGIDDIKGNGINDDANGDADLVDQNRVWDYCNCETGFVENVNRTCDVGFEQPCSQIWDDWKCDSVGRLVCRDGFCGCPDPTQIFDKVAMKCRYLVGSACDLRVADQCVENANCTPHRGGFVPFGYCQCEDGYYLTEEQICR